MGSLCARQIVGTDSNLSHRLSSRSVPGSGALFDPLALDDQATQRITNWGGVDCLLWLAVSLVPVADWRLKVYCDRYVR